jgi:hypothetical protein
VEKDIFCRKKEKGAVSFFEKLRLSNLRKKNENSGIALLATNSLAFRNFFALHTFLSPSLIAKRHMEFR